tara:strand:- start:867 stop:1796 length:930 start_codon:yes stop_codon:yes gene_type:complete
MADRIIKGDSGNDVVIQNNGGTRKIEVTNSGDVEVTGDFKVTTVKATNLKANDGTQSLEIADSTGQVTSSGKIDLNGNELILDADADTSITADTDDQIDIKIAGTDKARIDSSGIRLLGTDADTSSQILFNDTGGQEWGIQYDAGALKFSESGVATQVTMSDAGNVTFNTGNLIFGGAGKGIYLGVTSATAANLMDDYEEGSISGTFTNGSYDGNYTKIGRQVTLNFRILSTGSHTGNIPNIALAPFANASANYAVGTGWGVANPFNHNFLACNLEPSTTTVNFYSDTGGSGITMTGAGELRFSVTYFN